jgi:hypothetical protein
MITILARSVFCPGAQKAGSLPERSILAEKQKLLLKEVGAWKWHP